MRDGIYFLCIWNSIVLHRMNHPTSGHAYQFIPTHCRGPNPNGVSPPTPTAVSMRLKRKRTRDSCVLKAQTPDVTRITQGFAGHLREGGEQQDQGRQARVPVCGLPCSRFPIKRTGRRPSSRSRRVSLVTYWTDHTIGGVQNRSEGSQNVASNIMFELDPAVTGFHCDRHHVPESVTRVRRRP